MFDRPSVTNINSGDGNQLNAERDIVINEVPEPKGSAIQNLLMNILNIFQLVSNRKNLNTSIIVIRELSHRNP